MYQERGRGISPNRGGPSQKYEQRSRNYDLESGSASSFDEASVRRAFIRKVYSILFVQLLVAFGVVCAFSFCEPLQKFAFQYIWIGFILVIIYLVLFLAIMCVESCRRQVPLNFILLSLFTIVLALMAGFCSAFYRTEIVLMAIGITCGVCLLLTLFAMQTKIDFTTCGAFLCVLVVIMFVATIVGFFIQDKIFHLVIACFGVSMFSLFLIYDTQLMMGGNHKYSISPEDYIMAALLLYVDIIMIFLYILQILGFIDD